MAIPTYIVEPLPTLGIDYFFLFTANPNQKFLTIFCRENLATFERTLLLDIDLSNEEGKKHIEERMKTINNIADSVNLLTMETTVEMIKHFKLPADLSPTLYFEECKDCNNGTVYGRIVVPTPKTIQRFTMGLVPEDLLIIEGI